MKEKPFKVGALIGEGWRLMKANFGFFVGYMLIMIVAFLSLLGLELLTNHSFKFEGSYLPSGLVYTFFILTTIGLYNSALMIVSGVKPGFDQLLKNWRMFLSFIFGGYLFGLMFGVGIVLLIVPGLYVWARYGLYQFAILDQDLGPVKALKFSAKITEGARWQMFWLQFVCFLINILGLLCLVVGLFITIPVSLLALALAYKKLVARGQQQIEIVR